MNSELKRELMIEHFNNPVNKGLKNDPSYIKEDKNNICVRSGDHYDKKLKDELNITNTVRVSLYFYNTKEEIDKLVEALDNDKILEESLGV